MNKKVLLLFTLYFLFFPSQSHAWEGDVDGVATFKSLESLYSNILGVALNIIGLTTFVVIVIGGFKYLTAGGDAKATDEAKAAISYGILGLALAIGAWIILSLISQFTGANLLQFKLNF